MIKLHCRQRTPAESEETDNDVSFIHFSTEADCQRASETQVHHTLHKEDRLSDRADRSLQTLEVRGTRRGVQL